MGTGIRIWTALAFASAGWMVLVLPATPASPAFAEPAWRFEPESPQVGDTVDIIGTDWLPFGGDVSIFAPGVIASDESSEPFKTAKVDEGGGFIITDVEVPPLAGRQQTFSACQSCPELNGPDSPAYVEATLSVQPSFDFEEDNGLPGTTITVTGSGWLLGQGPVLLFTSEADSDNADNLIGSYDIQDNGTLVPDSSMEVPGYDPAIYNFFACQLCGLGDKTWGLEVPFTVDDAPPTEFDPDFDFELEVPEAEEGQEVTVVGEGWSDAAGEVFVYADASDVLDGSPLASEPVDGGSFTTRIRIPVTDAEVLSIFACQECETSSDLTAERDLSIVAVTEIVAQLTLSTDSGSPGTEFHAIGTGWEDGQVRLFARNESVQQRPLGPATATNGSFEADLVVPDIGFGAIDIVACQLCDATEPRQDVESFTVVKPVQDSPSLTVEPPDVRSGERVVVSGADWSQDDGELTVFLKRLGSTSPRTEWFRVTPEAAGTFSEEVDAPDLDAADYRVVACQRCDDPSGFPRATQKLVISEDGPNWLLVAMVAGLCLILLVAALVVVLLRRGAQPAPSEGPDQQPSPEPPRVRPYADPVLDVRLRDPPGGAAHVELPSLDVVAHPDPARLADQVEVRT